MSSLIEIIHVVLTNKVSMWTVYAWDDNRDDNKDDNKDHNKKDNKYDYKDHNKDDNRTTTNGR